MATQITATPALLRASAQDAGNRSMRKAGRTSWNDDDWNVAAETLDRLNHALSTEMEAAWTDGDEQVVG